MNLPDLKRKKPSSADPAHAFGSEEQLREEYRRQSAGDPRQGASGQTGGVFSSLRDRLSPAQGAPRAEAPVYGANTYDSSSAPDMGWEAAFSDQPAPASQEEPEAPRETPKKGLSFEEFKNTVYSSPYQAVYDTPGQSWYPPQAQGYYPPQQAYYPPEQPYYPTQQAYYPQEQGYYSPQQPYYQEQAYCPPQQAYYPPEQPYYPPQQTYYPQGQPYYPAQGTYAPPQQAYYPQPGPASPPREASSRSARQPIFDADRATVPEAEDGGLFAELPVMGRQASPAPEAYVAPEAYAAPAEQSFSREQVPGPVPGPIPGSVPGGPAAGAAPARPARSRRSGTDLGYYFWSGSIVAGTALTLFAFVYACLI